VPSATIPRTRIVLIPRPASIQPQPAVDGNESFVRGPRLALISPLITALDGLQLTACSARVDAVAPTGGMAVTRAAWGMLVGVMVPVRVLASNSLP
jgi:hypothetical protein